MEGSMKQIKISFFASSLIFLSVVILLHAAITTQQTGSTKNYKFVNGQWFDGKKFQARTFYSVSGVFSDQQPKTVDEVVDLEGGYVVPPFRDAHNHYIGGPHNIDTILLEY